MVAVSFLAQVASTSIWPQAPSAPTCSSHSRSFFRNSGASGKNFSHFLPLTFFIVRAKRSTRCCAPPFYFARNSFEVLRRWRKRGWKWRGRKGAMGEELGANLLWSGAKWDKMAAPVTKRANNNEQRRCPWLGSMANIVISSMPRGVCLCRRLFASF